MFKKIGTITLIFIFLIMMPTIKVSAAEEKNVKDYMNLLQNSEAQEIQTMIEDVKKDLSLDVVVVITKDTKGKSSRAFADDYYDNNGYGIGTDYSGILLLINMEKREAWISTKGKAINIFTDGRIKDMIKQVTKELGSKKYGEGCKVFIKAVSNYGKLGVPEGQKVIKDPTTPKEPYLKRVKTIIKFFPMYLVAAGIAVATTVIASLSSKGKVTINSRTYEGGTFKLLDSRDDFIREAISRTKIETSANSDNNSSTHTSSSGETHGGGGGSF
nr:TPM domain-containing protein [Clostridium sp. UBA4548]